MADDQRSLTDRRGRPITNNQHPELDSDALDDTRIWPEGAFPLWFPSPASSEG